MLKKFFKNLFYRICGNCSQQLEDEYLLKIKNLELQLESKELSTDKLRDKIEELHVKKEAAEEKLKDLLEDNKINILDLKDWYYNRFDNREWYYNAYSTGLIEVSQVIRDGEQDVIIKYAKVLIKKYHLNNNSTPEEVIEVIARYFMNRNNWTYIPDITLYGKQEFWAPADISLRTRRGDCDSLAILMHNLIYYMFKELKLENHYWRLKFTAMGTLVEAHAFNIWLGEDGEWYVLESTLDLAGSFNRTWLVTPLRHNNLYYGNPWGFADRNQSWRGLFSSLQPYVNNGK